MNRKQEHAQWKENHIKALQSLGFVGSFRHLRTLENRAHYDAERYCNGEITEEQSDASDKAITAAVQKAFGGTLPAGFMINGDPRGYALKIDAEHKGGTIPDGMIKDWGGYGILAPEF